MSDDSGDATAPIDSWADAQKLLVETQDTYDIMVECAFAMTVFGLIPILNFLTTGLRVILAAVVIIFFLALDTSTNMTRLATFFNDESNWDDKSKYAAAMAYKKEQYTNYDAASFFTGVSEDDKSMLEFEEGGGIMFWLYFFFPTAALCLAPILLPLTVPTVSISFWILMLIFIASYTAEVYVLIGLVTQNAPKTLLSWMPNEAAALAAAV